MRKLALHISVMTSALSLIACGGSSSQQQLANAAQGCQADPKCQSDMQAALAVPANPGILSNQNLQIPPTGTTPTTSQIASGTSTSAPVITLDQSASTMNAADILNQKNTNNFERLSNYFGDRMQGKASTAYTQSDSPASDGAK